MNSKSKFFGGQTKPAPTEISNIIYIGNARCCHTMDWYWNAQALLAPKKVLFATDLIESESQLKLVRPHDQIVSLYNIDWLLLNRQSRFGNLWRNFVKTAMMPLQVWRTRRLAAHYRPAHPDLLFHAHTMYYLWVCWLAGVNYIGMPQGSEILLRPQRSKVYRYFAIKSIRAARKLTVDSVNMQNRIRELTGREAMVIQNGIDVAAIQAISINEEARRHILSGRGIHPIYRIERIIEARTRSAPAVPLLFTYPSWEEAYRTRCFGALISEDRDLGRLPTRREMYQLLAQTSLVISIPESDSSPRSVYEAIFCGCCVAVTYNPWVEGISACMKARLYFVDLEDPDWFAKALAHAQEVTRVPYVPSEVALDLFDQRRTLKRLAELCYNPNAAPGLQEMLAITGGGGSSRASARCNATTQTTL